MTSQRNLRIAYCTWQDPHDRRAFSGVHYYVRKALERHCGEVVCLGPLPSFPMRAGRLLNKFSGKLIGRQYDFLHSRAVARAFARRIEAKLRAEPCDVLFAPVVSETIAYLETPLPIVYMADATFALLEDSYPFFSNLLASSRRQGHEIERLAIDKSSLVIYASEWAAQSGRRDYGCPEDKIHVELLGCNLDAPPPREQALAREAAGPCRLLFISREWERKGGDLALATLRALVKSGVDARLHVIGCQPPDGAEDRVEVTEYLDKNDPEDAAAYQRAIDEATFLLAPTRRDCSPMIFSEAAAYGLPSITTAVGGVSSIVVDGENGYALPPEASAEEYARVIREALADPQRYPELVRRSRDRFETELNWDRWGRNVKPILEELARGSAPRVTTPG